MSRFVTALAICVLTSRLSLAADAQRENGIYFVSRSNEGTAVDRVDGGGKVSLDGLATPRFGKATMISVSNDNSRFRLDLRGAGPFPIGAETRHFAIYIDGLCAVAGGNSDRQPDGTMNLSSILIHGREATDKFAKVLGVQPYLRKHPGHQLLVR